LGGGERASGLSENPIQLFTLKGEPIDSNDGIRDLDGVRSYFRFSL
jgi:hypothetical protein